jgi:hypothetical protein
MEAAMSADHSVVARETLPQHRHHDLSDWQIALLKGIWRRPSLWVEGHPEIHELRRRGLVMVHERYLVLTEAGLSVVKAQAITG